MTGRQVLDGTVGLGRGVRMAGLVLVIFYGTAHLVALEAGALMVAAGLVLAGAAHAAEWVAGLRERRDSGR